MRYSEIIESVDKKAIMSTFNLYFWTNSLTPYQCIIYGNDHVSQIINSHKGKGVDRKNILACQKALIDAGFEGNATW